MIFSTIYCLRASPNTGLLTHFRIYCTIPWYPRAEFWIKISQYNLYVANHSMQRTLFWGPNGVRYREVSLYVYNISVLEKKRRSCNHLINLYLKNSKNGWEELAKQIQHSTSIIESAIEKYSKLPLSEKVEELRIFLSRGDLWFSWI